MTENLKKCRVPAWYVVTLIVCVSECIFKRLSRTRMRDAIRTGYAGAIACYGGLT